MIVATMVDTVYIGRIGSVELAALGFCFPLIMTLVSLSTGIGIGATSVIARFAGASNQGAVQRAATSSILLSLLVILTVSVVGYSHRTYLLTQLGATGEVLELASNYLGLWLYGYPVFSFSLFIGNIIRGVGEALWPGIIMGASAALQILIAPVLIFGLFGLPRMELEGAAWSFTLSRIITAIWTLWLLVYRFSLLTNQGLTMAKMLNDWLTVLRISVPATLSNLIGPASLIVVTAILSNYGFIVVAAFAIGSRIEALATMVLIALSSSTVPFIAQNWGGRQFHRAGQSLTMSYRFCLVYGFMIAACLMLFGEPLSLLISGNVEIAAIAYQNLLWVSGTFAFVGSALVSGSVFLALGKAKPVLVVGLIRLFLVYIPLVWLGGRYFGYLGVFIAIALTNVSMALVVYIWARIFLQRQLRFVGSNPNLSGG